MQRQISKTQILNDKRMAGVLGTRTQGGRMEGAM